MNPCRFLLRTVVGLVVWSVGIVSAQDAAIEGLKNEMKSPVGTNAPAAAKPAAPVIEELLPAAKPVAPEVKAPETEKPAVEAPAVQPKPADISIEDLLKHADKPAAAVEKPAEAVASPAPAEKPAGPGSAVAAPAEGKSSEEALKNLGGEDRQKMAKVLADMEKVRREALDLEGHKSLDAADKAFKQGEYTVASTQYKNALGKLPNIPANQAARERATDRVPECEYQAVLALVKADKPKEALAMAQAALLRYPTHKGLKKTVDKLSTVEEPSTTPPTGLSEVEKQMKAGKRQIAAREYDEARASFESVLAVEPENREAMRYLKEIGDRQYANNTVGRNAAASKMTAEVRKEWIPQYKMIKNKPGPDIAPDKTPREQPILDKMSKIIIPEIEFRQANINDVVEFLNKASVEGDKLETDPTKRGVNIILHLTPAGGGAAAPAKAGGEDALFGAPAPGGTGGGASVSDITFTARYISLLSALKIITKVAGLKWQIDGNIVMIVREGDTTGERIEIRMYPVEPTFIERATLAGAQPMAGAQTTRGGKELTTMDRGELQTGTPDLKVAFENMGMKWPPGSQITYNSAIGKVIVANTSENLAVFEQILKEINVVPKQVEIEARFVEVNETDMQEMGLEWLLNNDFRIASQAGGAFTPASALQRIQVNANSAGGGMTKGLRYFGTDTSGNETALAGGQGLIGNLLSVSSVLTNPELTMVLHLLQQNGNADLLSAPKVTTRAGAEASIRVVTEYIYPTSFEVNGGQLGVNNNNVNNANIVQQTTVVPQDFATREVGVILTVMPEVSPDGNVINLTMTPNVVTDPTWFQYGSTIKDAAGNTTLLNMPQPFFHVRTLTTQISIYDGATVVMGGLITENLQKTNDKIPILGDIPLLGMLFRSTTENSVKKNLMIFVTAKLVDPAGRVIRQQDKVSTDETGTLVPAAKTPESKP